MAPTDQLAAAQTIAAGVLSNVTPDQLGSNTPCAKWTVAELVDHLVGAQHWARSAMEGVEMTETGAGSSEGDFNEAFKAAAAASLASFQADGALARTVNPGFGDMPATALMGLATTDTFQHAWDLATATGQDNNLDPALASQILEAARQTIPPSFRSEAGDVFGPEQAAPEGANPATQLAAFLGRTV